MHCDAHTSFTKAQYRKTNTVNKHSHKHLIIKTNTQKHNSRSDFEMSNIYTQACEIRITNWHKYQQEPFNSSLSHSLLNNSHILHKTYSSQYLTRSHHCHLSIHKKTQKQHYITFISHLEREWKHICSQSQSKKVR